MTFENYGIRIFMPAILCQFCNKSKRIEFNVTMFLVVTMDFSKIL